MTVGLRKVSQQSSCCKIHILTEKTQMIGTGEEIFEHRSGFFLFTYFKQCCYHPERAQGEGGLWFAKIIIITVAVHESILTQPFLGFFDSAYITGIISTEKSIRRLAAST